MNVFYELKALIEKDVANENETKRAAVVLRLDAFIMCVYFLCIFATMAAGLDIPAAVLSLAGLAAHVLLFVMTYHNATKAAAVGTNLLLIVWVLYLTVTYGYETGVLNFLFIPVILLYITDYLPMLWKVIYVIVLFVLRIGFFVYEQGHGTVYEATQGQMFFLYFANVCAVFVFLLVSVSILTQDSRDMEQKLISYNEKLHKLASKDALTGLRNRRSILEYVNKKAADYESGINAALSIAIADIDFFKRINDTYGHNCGDEVLRKLAEVFEAFMEGKGRVGRWGGEEFLFVFNNYNGDDASYMLSRLQRIVRDMEISWNGEKIRLTMTFGLSEYDSRIGVEDTINEADGKLYMGKEKGRDVVVY